MYAKYTLFVFHYFYPRFMLCSMYCEKKVQNYVTKKKEKKLLDRNRNVLTHNYFLLPQ